MTSALQTFLAFKSEWPRPLGHDQQCEAAKVWKRLVNGDADAVLQALEKAKRTGEDLPTPADWLAKRPWDAHAVSNRMVEPTPAPSPAVLPAPLTPPECDLRDFAFMPLEGRRLLSSETWILGTPEERCAALALWIESWHQVPAGSLPDDDRVLAHLSQTGARWSTVKAHALRGFVKCADGRLYHPVIAEKACEAWDKRRIASNKGKAGAYARWVQSKRYSNSAGIAPANTQAMAQASSYPPDAPAIAQAMPTPMPGDGNRHWILKPTTAAKTASAYPPEFEAIWALYPKRDGDNPKRRALKAYRTRLAEGHTSEEISAGVERYAAWVRSKGKEGTEHVKQAATFFGPDKSFREPWKDSSASHSGGLAI